MSGPRIFDAFGGAGGSSEGYRRAGWEVVTVDSDPKLAKNCPGEFVCMDAFEFIAEHGHEFDAAHVGPPCQRKSRMTNCRPGVAARYPNLVKPVRVMLDWLGLPYVIENVVGSDVRPDVTLCGWTFGLRLYRHRVFESNVSLRQPAHLPHVIPASKAGHWRPGTIMSVSGHVAPMSEARAAMGIDWMNREQLAEAIPPLFTQYLGEQLLEALEARAA